MDIRPAALSDLESLLPLQREVQELHVAAHPKIYRQADDKDLRSGLRQLFEQKSTTVFIARGKEAALGFAVVVIEDRPENPYRFAARILKIEQFGVLKSARRQGVGKALIDTIGDFAHLQECEVMELDVLAFNENAQRFYLAEGFQMFRHQMSRLTSSDGAH